MLLFGVEFIQLNTYTKLDTSTTPITAFATSVKQYLISTLYHEWWSQLKSENMLVVRVVDKEQMFINQSQCTHTDDNLVSRQY